MFWVLVAVLVLVIVGASLLLGTIFVHLFILGCPFVPTSRKIAQKMVAFAKLKGTETVMDLGAGDGAILIEAKRMHPGIRAIGIEIVPTVWMLGKFRAWCYGQKVTLLCKNAFTVSVAEAEVIFLYLMPKLMAQMLEKFNEELKPGTVVISHAFPFIGREPTEVLEIGDGRRTKKLLKYVW